MPLFFVLFTGYTYESEICYEENINYYGNDIGLTPGVATAENCQVKCQQNDQCLFWTYCTLDWCKENCFLKSGKSNVEPSSSSISGPRYCPGN